MRLTTSMIVLGLTILIGCDGPRGTTDRQAPDEKKSHEQASATPSASSQKDETPTNNQSMAGSESQPAAAPVEGQPPADQPATEQVKADVGVGKKGRYEPGILTTPVSSYFASKEMAIFRIQIPQAMNFFQATNGRKPKDHDEFMQMLAEQGITEQDFPELPQGQKYVYDPATGQLMVERPAAQ